MECNFENVSFHKEMEGNNCPCTSFNDFSTTDSPATLSVTWQSRGCFRSEATGGSHETSCSISSRLKVKKPHCTPPTVPTVNVHDAKMMKQSTNDDGTSVRILIFSSVKMSHWVMRMQIQTINYDGAVWRHSNCQLGYVTPTKNFIKLWKLQRRKEVKADRFIFCSSVLIFKNPRW